MALKAITANRLRDGAVVWLGQSGDWTERLSGAALFEGPAADAALSSAAQAERDNIVVAIYAVDLEIRDGAPVPLRTRERLRALGPSVRPDLGYQADITSSAA